MKKAFVLFAVVLYVLLSSCGAVNGELSRDVLKEKYPEMYLMPEEECGHSYLFCESIEGMNLDLSSEEYHYEYCAYPNCAHKNGAVPHSEIWNMIELSQSFLGEDGNAYHNVFFECTGCGKLIYTIFRCRNNVEKCPGCYLNKTYRDRYTMEEWQQIALGQKKLADEEQGEK